MIKGYSIILLKFIWGEANTTHANVTCSADVRASGQDRTHPHALSFRKEANRSAEKSLQSGKGHDMPKIHHNRGKVLSSPSSSLPRLD
jgi:hypothetical protein